MKNLKLFSIIAFVTFLIVAISCKKKNSSSNLKDVLISKNEDGASIFKTSEGYKLSFKEDEDIDLGPQLSKAIGMEDLQMEKGNYNLIYSDNNYGKVTFKVKGFKAISNSTNAIYSDVSENTESIDSGIGIYIAKLYSQKCNLECLCGIGFRCGISKGITGVSNQTIKNFSINGKHFVKDPNRFKKAHIYFDKDKKILTIQFIEKVNWLDLM